MKSSLAIHSRRIAMFGVLASLVVAAFFVLQAADKPKTTAPSTLAQDMIGTWALIGAPGEPDKAPAKGARLKFFTGQHWIITEADPETGVTIFHHGGTYTLTGNDYAETIDYANESTKELIKKTFKFTVKVEGDKYTQVGVDNSWNEVWKRVK